ncbi:unnamed protein product [Porites evermanni]|uniref:Uncharacterized protein n=1 Tax=Porites evermanni TaxID=104178 RepID=A0ABN8SBH8_9CNID|nr:unnamed protein product [Porites evermanni]
MKDAERMLSFLVAKFLREHGYEMEARYVQIVADWHEAADGRGISQLERCQKNYAMLNLILDEWMPWHRELYDFRSIDINRPVKEICGFSCETVVAVANNIESMEFQRCQNNEIGYEEHPRAGSTDDVEAIIAFLHRILGVVFTLKQFKSGWRNIVRCFTKRMSPDLPFYYWTLNERFRDEDQMTSFDQLPYWVEDNQDPTCHPLRLHHLPMNRIEDASIIFAGHSFLPARNQTSIRQQIHRPLAPTSRS